MQHAGQLESGDVNLVEMWTRKDPKRWTAGILAGAFAGLIMAAFAMLVAVVLGKELWFPLKFAALPVLGPVALTSGMYIPGIIVGLIVHELVSAFWGFVFAHFVQTNHLPSLMAMGLVWGTFAWIFIFDLFAPAFKPIYWVFLAGDISLGASFFVHLVWGLALTSVAFFDRAVRGGR